MLTLFWSFIGFVITMGIIVTIHEWGHYQVAKWFNIKVLKFSIGFGKPIWSKQSGETEVVIAQIPLGGYVKFADEREEPVAEKDLPRAFNRQSVYKKMAVVLAGPMVNLIFAWMAFTLMFMIGTTGLKPLVGSIAEKSPIQQAMLSQGQVVAGNNIEVVAVNGKSVDSWQTVHQQLLQALANGDSEVDMAFSSDSQSITSVTSISLATIDINNHKQDWLKILGLQPTKPKIPAVLGEVLEGSPAEQGGLESKDKILKIDDITINSWQDFVKVVQSRPGKDVAVVYERNQAQFQTHITLLAEALPDNREIGKMGVGAFIDEEAFKKFQTNVSYGFWGASDKALERSVELVDMSLVMLKRMLLGEVSTENLSGPISIAQFSGQALQNGFIAFLSLLGLLSLSIGILNLLPIPVLDGGHLMFYIIEAVKGSPVSDQTMYVGQIMGLTMLIGLTFLAVSNDILRIVHG